MTASQIFKFYEFLKNSNEFIELPYILPFKFFQKIQHTEFTCHRRQCGLDDGPEHRLRPTAEYLKRPISPFRPAHWHPRRPLAENPRVAALDAATHAYQRPRPVCTDLGHGFK